MTDIFAALAAPFPPDRVSWRVGSMTKDKAKARALAYIDARDVMQRLDQACGPGNWRNRYSHVGQITVCEIDIRIDGAWLDAWRANGAGHSDIEAEKGALSDAFKRAAVLWGIGQYLYDVDSSWIVLDEYKQIPKTELLKLRALLPSPAGSTPQKNASAARKDGDWKVLVEPLAHCMTLQDIADFVAAKKDDFSKLPEGWKQHARDAIIAARERCQAAAA